MTLEELEGFAVWTELHFAEKAGEYLYVENYKNDLRRRNDAYWKGFQELEESLKQAPPTVRTPFDLYKNTSGRRAVDF
ncbi:hypothetical protein [Alkalicoccus saliphilus]|jgi:hypothetical protein|uniref:Uncharacterized protein n=1 Tax=Alkalicoccus saliphilus TaxID=200989 RepID=A0A2T4U5Z0_9BACI|nr:hypothetical protein [Alkalicoccus saliphilus]PTL38821.1 hypothetical protein C6Y45_09290 [Alkalicoccus saliphilus]